MKVSIRKGEPGFENFNPALLYRVMLDDRHVDRCLAFDTEAGTVEVVAASLDREFVIDESRNDVARTILRGRVTYSTEPRPKPMNVDFVALSDEERTKYETVWTNPEYRQSSPGERNALKAVSMLELQPAEFVVDFGSGSCAMMSKLWEMGFRRVVGVDIAHNAGALPSLPVIISPIHDLPNIYGVDAGLCIDVMEHIPEALVDATLERIAAISPRTYFHIAMFHDTYGEKFGVGQLHLTVKSQPWWEEKLREHFESVRSVPSGEGLVAAFVAESEMAE